MWCPGKSILSFTRAQNGKGLVSVFGASSLATTDSLRLKCREMIANALKGNGELPDGVVAAPEQMAEQVGFGNK